MIYTLSGDPAFYTLFELVLLFLFTYRFILYNSLSSPLIKSCTSRKKERSGGTASFKSVHNYTVYVLESIYM